MSEGGHLCLESTINALCIEGLCERVLDLASYAPWPVDHGSRSQPYEA